MKSKSINRQTQIFQLNMTFVHRHRQRNQIRLTQTLLTDGTSQKDVFLWWLCKRLHKCKRTVKWMSRSNVTQVLLRHSILIGLTMIDACKMSMIQFAP